MTAAGWKGAVAAPLPEPARRIPVAADSDRLARARAYVLKMPEAIAGSGGHAATWNVARKLAADFELPEADVLSVLVHDYNPRCQPQWSERELRHKAAQAVQKARVANPIQDRPRETPRSHFTKREQHDTPDLAGGADSLAFEDWEPNDLDAPDAPAEVKGPTTEAKAFAVLGSEEIFAELEAPDYLIDQVVRRGSLVEIVAYGSSGKTWIAVDAALAVAAGLSWLGRFEAKRGTASYFDYENGCYEMRRRIQGIARGRGLTFPVSGVELCSMPNGYMSEGAEFGNRMMAHAKGKDLVVIDTLKAANPGVDENDSNMRVGLDQFRRIAEATGCAFIVLVHAKKSSGAITAPDPREAGRGSSAIFDAADSVIHVTYAEGKPLRVQQTKSRQGRTIDPFDVTLTDPEGGGVCVQASDLAKDQSGAEGGAQFTALCDDVLAAVRANPGVSGRVIRARIAGKRAASVIAALETLETHGAIRNAGTATRAKWFPTGKEMPKEDPWADVAE